MREGVNQRLESLKGAWQGKRAFSGEIVQNWRVALSHFAVAVGNEEEVMVHP